MQAVIYSLHEAAKGEMPGKASNVNAAVRNFVAHLCTDASTVMCTIIDAGELVACGSDAWGAGFVGSAGWCPQQS
jgi:hypothetical protein